MRHARRTARCQYVAIVAQSVAICANPTGRQEAYVHKKKGTMFDASPPREQPGLRCSSPHSCQECSVEKNRCTCSRKSSLMVTRCLLCAHAHCLKYCAAHLSQSAHVGQSFPYTAVCTCGYGHQTKHTPSSYMAMHVITIWGITNPQKARYQTPN